MYRPCLFYGLRFTRHVIMYDVLRGAYVWQLLVFVAPPPRTLQSCNMFPSTRDVRQPLPLKQERNISVCVAYPD